MVYACVCVCACAHTHTHHGPHMEVISWQAGGNHLYLLSHLTGPGPSFQCNSELALLSKKMCQSSTERTKNHCWVLTLPTLRKFFRGSRLGACADGDADDAWPAGITNCRGSRDKFGSTMV